MAIDQYFVMSLQSILRPMRHVTPFSFSIRTKLDVSLMIFELNPHTLVPFKRYSLSLALLSKDVALNRSSFFFFENLCEQTMAESFVFHWSKVVCRYDRCKERKVRSAVRLSFVILKSLDS